MKLRFLQFLAFSAACVAAERPNIVFIFSDDHAQNAISAYGGPLQEVAPTPRLDQIADEGAIFTRSFCSNSICGPSRAAILTGKHSHINGYIDNNNSTFDGTQTTFPKLLQKVGYQTAIVGKWHLVTEPTGFDFWEVLPGQGNYYNPDMRQMDGTRKRYEGYCTDIVTDIAIDWLDNKREKDEPFVLMCQHKAPHRNWSPAPRHVTLFDDVEMPEPATLFDDYANRSSSLKEQAMSIEKDFAWGHDMKFHGEPMFPEHFIRIMNREYERMTDAQKKNWDAAYGPKNEKFIADMKAGKLSDKEIVQWKYQRYIKDYLRCIRALDENVGRLLDHLDKTGLAENTIVIYSSDQGFYLGEHGWYDKRWMFEESLEMPFLIRWPGVIKPGSTSDALIQNIDYAPTFLEVAGADIPETVQGRSLVPVLKANGKTPDDWREGIYYYYSGESTHAVAKHDGVRSDRYKLMWFPETKEWNLFDLEKDPQEMKSVASDPQYADILKDMKSLYQELREQFQVSEATVPAHRKNQKWWNGRHEAKRKEALRGDFDLVFLGDSITQGWEGAGKEVWKEYYGDRKALNLGFSGDRTEHVLWRLLNGELANVDPEVFVLMIGTNNTGHRKDRPKETAEGVELIVELLQDRCPESKILLLGVFPRDAKPEGPNRVINDQVNEHIQKLADAEESVHYMDLSDEFLAEDGTLSKEVMPDLLHPKAKGYGIWAEAMEPKLKELLGE
ncbi:MAG: sulfatase/phosphatase domain-containing protein [Verrucomicrobiales bacterium]